MPVLNEFAIISGVLSADVANAGTFTVGYPTGFRLGDFRAGKDHKLVVAQKLFSCPNDFTVAYTSATVITVTNNTGTTLRAGSTFRLQMDVGGVTPVPGVENAMYTQTIRVNFGAPVVSSATALRAAAAIGAGGAITLLTAGQTFDVPRNVIITSAGNDSGRTFVVTGLDDYGSTTVENITGANAGVAAGKKAFKSITSISIDAAAAGNVSIGFGDVLGLPVWTPATAILKETQDGAAATAGTLVAGLSVLTKSTATTADVRGTYDPNAACDGARVFELDLVLADPTFTGNPQFAG